MSKPGEFRAAIEEHGRRKTRPAGGERGHRGVARRHGDEAVDAPADQRLDPALFDRRVLAGGDEQEIVAVALGERLDAVDEAGEKDVGDVGDDHADEAGRGAAQRARGAVDPVAESSIASRTRRRLASPTGRLPFATLDAVATETPARAATSRMVGGLDKSVPSPAPGSAGLLFYNVLG